MFFGMVTGRMQLKLTPRQERDRCLLWNIERMKIDGKRKKKNKHNKKRDDC